MVKTKEIEVDYKNPLHLLWAIPTGLVVTLFLLIINFWLTLKQSWIFFQVFIIKDVSYLKKKWNKQLNDLKVKI